MKSSPRSPKLEKARAQQQRPNAAKKEKKKKKKPNSWLVVSQVENFQYFYGQELGIIPGVEYSVL